MATVRMIALAGASLTLKVYGRTYTIAAGGTIDVPDFDAAELSANGWLALCGTVGTSAARPTNPAVGQQFNDTTVAAMVIWNGKSWVHHQQGNVA